MLSEFKKIMCSSKLHETLAEATVTFAVQLEVLKASIQLALTWRPRIFTSAARCPAQELGFKRSGIAFAMPKPGS